MKRLLLYAFFILNTTAVFSQTLTGSKLEISSTDSHLARFYYNDNDAGQTRPRLDIWATPNKINVRTTYGTGGAQLSFGTNQVNDALFIANYGRIGIGTTNPDANLHVYGVGSGLGTTASTIMLGKLNGPEIRAIQARSDDDVQELAFRVKSSASHADPNFEALRIKYNGYVGIGTPSPSTNLHVFGRNAGQGETLSSIMLGKNNGPEIRAIQARTDDDVQELAFRVKSSASHADPNFEALRIKFNGFVGIGTTNPDAPLTVAGKVHAQEVKVTATAGGADFVFADDYALPKLAEVAAFVKQNKHLPEIPSAAEMEANGLHLAEMNIKLLQKLEELTLYTIEQENQLAAQQASINTQKEQLAEKDRQFQDLLNRMERLEQQIQE